VIGSILKHRFALIIITFGLSVLGIGMTLFWNLQVSRMIDAVSTGGIIARGTIAAALAVIACMTVNGFLTLYLSGWTCETFGHDLRMRAARCLVTRPELEMESTSAGAVLSKAQNELTEVAAFLRNNLFAFAEDAVNFSGTLIWMLCIDPKLTLLSHLPLVPITWYVFKSSQIIQSYAQISQDANARVGGWVDTLPAAFPILRVFQAEPAVRGWHEKALEAWEKSSAREERVRARLMSLSAILRFLPLILLFALGGPAVIRGEMSLGTLYIMLNLSGNVSGVVTNLPNRVAGLRRFFVNAKRIEDQFGEEE